MSNNEEIVNTYRIDEPETLAPMNRGKFYEEQIESFKKHNRPTRAVDIVGCLIFNPKGEVLLQKRSHSKNHNPGLIDKTLGGHIQYGDVPDYTVMVETIQELQTPSIVLRNKNDFEKTFDLLRGYLGTVSLIKYVDSDIHILPKIIKDERIDIANRLHFYIGVYNGRVKPSDGEAQGVLWYSLEDLEKEMARFPETFTDDIKIFMKRYANQIKEFREYIIQ